jgi:hypothetical protein
VFLQKGHPGSDPAEPKWIPAFAGMTAVGGFWLNKRRPRRVDIWMDVSQITEGPKQPPTRSEPQAGAGVAAEMPRHIYRYVLASSGWHQLPLVVLTVAVFLLEIVPLELQRRVVNDLVKHRDFSFIIGLWGSTSSSSR